MGKALFTSKATQQGDRMLRKLAGLVVLVLAAAPVYAASPTTVPATVTQQGRLLNLDGTPAVGPVSVVFTLYDAATAGNTLWTETQSTVALDDGYFSIQLGSVTPFTAGLWNGAISVPRCQGRHR